MGNLKTIWRYGWPGGLFMFVVVEIIPMIKRQAFDPFMFFVGLALWSFGALWMGYIIQRVMRKRH